MDFVLQLVAILVTGGMLYGGIRADLRSQKESIARAHQRIDDHIGKGHP